MRPAHRAKRLTIIVGESDTWHHRPVYAEIVHRAHSSGLAGATAVRGVEGFGVGGLIHTTRLLSLAEELPVVVLLVDRQDRIEAFLPQLDELVGGGLVLLEDCVVLEPDRPVPDPGGTIP